MDRSRCLFACAVGCVLLAAAASAQQPPVHYFHSGQLPPGTVGQGQLQRFASLRGYTQPVKILLPGGARVSFVGAGEFNAPQPSPTVVGMQVGSVYQLRVTNIPFELGREVYPTIEIVNRLYPPAGQQLRFPVPVEITQEELEYALEGRYVTRVIYLEDRATALGHADEPDRQRYFEAGPGEDPLRVADQLGRPMAILRLGSRVPDLESGLAGLGNYPAPLLYSPEDLETVDSDTQAAVERAGANVPRVDLPGSQRTRLTQPAGLVRP